MTEDATRRTSAEKPTTGCHFDPEDGPVLPSGGFGGKMTPDLQLSQPDSETTLLTTSIAFPVPICPGWQVAYGRVQWVLQHWRTPRWRDRAFCRTRAGLELRIRELVGREYQAAVAHLPDWHR